VHEDFVFRLIPRDEQFFEMFADLARRVTAAARLLDKMFAEPDQLRVHATAIKDLEHEADVITHSVIDRIHRVFITPFDREDIHQLVQELDDVIDMIDGAARRAGMFGINESREGVRELTEKLVRATEAIEWAVTSMKQPKIVEAAQDRRSAESRDQKARRRRRYDLQPFGRRAIHGFAQPD
jgi:uncharacterized protein